MFQEVKVENVTVDSVVRLGKKAADPTQNLRPMKVVLDSVESSQSIEKSKKKLEGKGGGRMVKGIHTPGSDNEAAGSQETFSGRTEAAESQQGKGPVSFQRQSVKEKIQVKVAGELLCFYINAKKLLNKFDDFAARIHDIDPYIVSVTERWATSDYELTLQGYDLFRHVRPVAREGGGVLLYVKHRLRTVKCELSSKFPKQVWCYFQDAKKIKCYVGVCYRTPTISIFMVVRIMICCKVLLSLMKLVLPRNTLC